MVLRCFSLCVEINQAIFSLKTSNCVCQWKRSKVWTRDELKAEKAILFIESGCYFKKVKKKKKKYRKRARVRKDVQMSVL